MFKRLGLILMGTAASTIAMADVVSTDFKIHKAPEIDPASAVAGLTLLAGALAVMLGRRSKRLQTQAD